MVSVRPGLDIMGRVLTILYQDGNIYFVLSKLPDLVQYINYSGIENINILFLFLRLWKCFTPDPNKKKEAARSKSGAVSSLRMGIR